MASCILPNMSECTVIRPSTRQTWAWWCWASRAQFTYGDHIDVLPNLRIPKLDTLAVRTKAWKSKRKHTTVWSGMVGQVTPLKLRVLPLDTY